MQALIYSKNINCCEALNFKTELDTNIYLVDIKNENKDFTRNNDVIELETMPVLNFMTLERLDNFKSDDEFMYFVMAKEVDKSEGWALFSDSPSQEADKFIYLQDDGLSMSEYLEKIMSILEHCIEQNKKPILYQAFERGIMPCRTMLDKIVNKWFDELEGILIYYSHDENVDYYSPDFRIFEPYIQHAVYTNDFPNHAFLKLNTLSSIYHKNLKREYRQVNILYDDVFYKQLPQDEIITIVLNILAPTDVEYYQKLDIEYISLLNNPGILRAKKSTLEKSYSQIKPYIVPEYYPQILTTPEIQQKQLQKAILNQEAIQDKIDDGEGVLVGVIDVEHINIYNKLLQTIDVQSRIEYIWEQTNTTQGNEYTQENITAKLSQPINSPNQLSIGTALMLLATGNNKGDSLYLPNLKFVMAKIQPASENMQRIYGGTYNPKAVVLSDLIIGITKLVEYAQNQKKPIVICLQYGTNISSHDGSAMLEDIISAYTSIAGVTILTTVGEEGNQKHHERHKVEHSFSTSINIEADNSNIVGAIWSGYPGGISVRLKNAFTQEYYNLNAPNIFNVNKGSIYTRGRQISYTNGSINILFRLESLDIGSWELDVELIHPDKGEVDIWLADAQFNQTATLENADAFITIPSLGNIKGVICVGAYDNQALTITRDSGRGYTRDGNIVPTCVIQSINIEVPLDEENAINLNGSLVALGLMAGEAAGIYSILRKKELPTLPNTPIMSYWLSANLEQISTLEYPNPMQGYGVYTLRNLKNWLLFNGIISGTERNDNPYGFKY